MPIYNTAIVRGNARVHRKVRGLGNVTVSNKAYFGPGPTVEHSSRGIKESVYVEYDDSFKEWCVFGLDSGHCYNYYGEYAEALDAAVRHNENRA